MRPIYRRCISQSYPAPGCLLLNHYVMSVFSTDLDIIVKKDEHVGVFW